MSFSSKLSASAIRRAWWATASIFLIHGLVISAWLSRIPAVQNELHLTNGVLGLTLLGAACGCVFATPLCGWMVNRYGSRKVTAIASLGLCFALIPLPLASSAAGLSAGLFLFGGFAATMDVAMNAQAVEVERAYGRPSMSRFHAMFSLGGMAGAGLGGALAARGVGPLQHFVAAALVLSTATAVVAPYMLASPSRTAEKGRRLPLSQIPAELFAISA